MQREDILFVKRCARPVTDGAVFGDGKLTRPVTDAADSAVAIGGTLHFQLAPSPRELSPKATEGVCRSPSPFRNETKDPSLRSG